MSTKIYASYFRKAPRGKIRCIFGRARNLTRNENYTRNLTCNENYARNLQVNFCNVNCGPNCGPNCMCNCWCNFHARAGNCVVLQKPLAAGKAAIPAQVFHVVRWPSIAIYIAGQIAGGQIAPAILSEITQNFAPGGFRTFVTTNFT